MVVEDDAKHLKSTVTQSPHFTYMFVGNDVEHRLRQANTPMAIYPISVSNDVELRWYLENDGKYRLHNLLALT